MDWTVEDVEPTLASAVHNGRMWTKQSLRRLAKASGVSAAQISRIETGQVDRPSIETLIGLAAALDYHPTPILVLGGQLRGKRARTELARVFDEAHDSLTAEYGKESVKRLKARVASASSDDQLREMALYVVTLSVPEALWPAALAATKRSSPPDAELLQDVMKAWPELSADRRWRLLELARDMRAASRQERRPHAT